jgi:fructose-1,6-bisphosphatase/inositol monophosphatase family enzyme
MSAIAGVDVDLVAQIIREVAAAEVMPRWRNLKAEDVAQKTGPDDLVTVADKAAEMALTQRLAGMLAGSGVVGEEAVAADASIMSRFQGEAPLWVIDPIDGTQAFATGQPEFTIMVGLVVGRRPVAGWIYAPAADTMHWAVGGHGAWREGRGVARQRLERPLAPQSLAQSRGIIGRRMLAPERLAHIEAQVGRFEALSPATFAGHQYPWLYEGRAHFCMFSKSEPWDHLPGLAIATELGLAYCKHDGTAYVPGDNRGGLLVGHDDAQLSALRDCLLGP